MDILNICTNRSTRAPHSTLKGEISVAVLMKELCAYSTGRRVILCNTVERCLQVLICPSYLAIISGC